MNKLSKSKPPKPGSPTKVVAVWKEREDETSGMIAASTDAAEGAEEEGPLALQDGQPDIEQQALEDQQVDNGQLSLPTAPQESQQNSKPNEANLKLDELQLLLQQEEESQTEQGLKKEEDRQLDLFRGEIQKILELWEEPAMQPHADANELGGEGDAHANVKKDKEWHLRDLQQHLDSSLCQNIGLLGVADEWPSLEGVNIMPEVAQRLVHYEELLWMLQQQPCYVANLADELEFDKETPLGTLVIGTEQKEIIKLPKDFFYGLVSNLYHEISDARTRHLFMALIRTMMKKEIQSPTSAGSVCNPSTSKIPYMVFILIKHPFFGELHKALLNPANEKSLFARIQVWTMNIIKARGDEKTPENKDSKVAPPGEASFALHESELNQWNPREAEGNAKGDKVKRQEAQEHVSKKLQENHEKFKQFLGPPKDPEDKVDPPYQTLARFLDEFDIYDELKCLLRHLHDLMNEFVHSPNGSKNSNKQEGKKERETSEPVIRLLLASLLGYMLKHHEMIMTWEMNEEAKRLAHENITQHLLGQPASAVDKKKGEMMRKIHLNVKSVGNFLIKAAGKSQDPAVESFIVTVKDIIQSRCLKKMIKS